MKKGKWFALALAMLLAFAAAAGASPAYDVITPPGYTDTMKYPVVYILPQSGAGMDDSALADMIAQAAAGGPGMILVKPQLATGMDLHAALDEIIAEVDGQYSTIADAQHRAAVGTGAGGYLAYAAALLDGGGSLAQAPARFGLVGSIDGNFAQNGWTAAYGSLIEKLRSIPDGPDEETPNDYGQIPPENNTAEMAAFLSGLYTYMDTPADSAWANDAGSTNELGALCIELGLADTAHEYTTRPGAMTADFMAESAGRMVDRFSRRMLSGVVAGDVKLDSPSLPESAPAATGTYSASVGEALGSFSCGSLELTATVSLVNPATGETLDCVTKTHAVRAGESVSGDFSLSNTVPDAYAQVRLTLQLLGTDAASDTASLIRTRDAVMDGDKHVLSLMGDWHFHYADSYMMGDIQNPMNGEDLMAADYASWAVVQPGLGNWHDGYGNIANPMPGYISADIFGLMITGSGYYAKAFALPADFARQDLILSIGKIDDRCEVYINGHFVGATGMENHAPTGETTWAVYSHFDVDPACLNYGGENVVFVRAWNDTSGGAGGWYQGPIGLYSKAAFEEMNAESASSRFYEETYYSNALGAEKEYLIYLPESYDKGDRFYPTIYLLHQFNSDHTSYRVDAVDKLFDEGAREGLFDEAIVVIPNSSEMSFWTNNFMGMPGRYEDMLVDDLIPHIEANYRCIPDARYRLTAGCSMGGQGAMSVALTHPNLFTGAVSFFGAFSYGGQRDPNAIAAGVSDAYLKHFSLYFSCGNQDYYDFGVPAIQLNRQLQSRGIAHSFFIENGGHDGAFYLPKFKSAFADVRGAMYQMPEADVSALLAAGYALDPQTGDLLVTLDAKDGLADYFLTVPDSPYTADSAPGVTLPVIVTLQLADGELRETFLAAFDDDTRSAAARIPLPQGAQISRVTIQTQLLGGANANQPDGLIALPVGGE